MPTTGGVETDGDTRPGRPRDPQVDRAIVGATLKLLADQGYRGMSIEGVAAEAGVGKTTIYRRYGSKEELVVGAFSTIRESTGSVPDTGSVRTDIAGMMTQSRTAFLRVLALLGAVLAEEHRNPRLLELLRERVLGPRRDEVVMMLRRGVRRGEIRSDIDPAAAVHAIVGSIFVRRLLGIPESDEWIRQTIDVIFGGLTADR